MAGGKITVTESSIEIRPDEAAVSQVLWAECKNEYEPAEKAYYTPADYLVHGESYSGEDVSVSTTGENIDFQELVTYENWSRK